MSEKPVRILLGGRGGARSDREHWRISSEGWGETTRVFTAAQCIRRQCSRCPRRGPEKGTGTPACPGVAEKGTGGGSYNALIYLLDDLYETTGKRHESDGPREMYAEVALRLRHRGSDQAMSEGIQAIRRTR